MALGSNSKVNVGIRRFVASVGGYRNFEPNGTQTYNVASDKGYSHAGNSYAKGATIPYDAAGGTLYGNYPRLERDFNRRVLDPSS